MARVSTLVVARDAERTIAESIESVLAEPVDELLVVDDRSSDRTAEIARSYESSRVRVAVVDAHRTLGYARQFGLERISGEFCFLLDADDLFLRGRVGRLTTALVAGRLDFIADEIELFEEGREPARRMEIPGFLDSPPGLWRLFERNYLPGIGQIAFRTERMRCLGYDPELHGVEDSNLVMRALLDGARYGLVREVGYRMRHTANSVSRNRVRQGQQLAQSLRSLNFAQVESRVRGTGVEGRICQWILWAFSVYRTEYREALGRAEALAKGWEDSEEVLEPAGPFPYEEGWRVAFACGTLSLLVGNANEAAVAWLERTLRWRRTPEALQNLGVALARRGEPAPAKLLWEEALMLNPGYADAQDNLRGLERITSMPLRREASRSEY